MSNERQIVRSSLLEHLTIDLVRDRVGWCSVIRVTSSRARVLCRHRTSREVSVVPSLSRYQSPEFPWDMKGLHVVSKWVRLSKAASAAVASSRHNRDMTTTHLHEIDYPLTMEILDALFGGRDLKEGFVRVPSGAIVDWEILENECLSRTERATAEVAHGISIIEWCGGFPGEESEANAIAIAVAQAAVALG